MTRRISDDELLDELRRLTEELGRVPTTADMTECGKYGANTYSRRFGSWSAAIEAANLKPAAERNRSDDELLAEIDRLAETLGAVPTAEEMNEEGTYSAVTYRDRFGSWNNALRAAGYNRHTPQKHMEAELLAELQRVREIVGRTPRKEDMDEEGEFSSTTYINRFGSWNDALSTANLEPNRRGKISRDELVAELQRVATEVGDSPTIEEFSEHAKYSVSPYNDRFEGWDRALEAAGLTPNRQYNVSREELLEELERLHMETGEIPTVTMMQERGRYSFNLYYKHFESWRAALAEWGFGAETE